MPFLYDDDAIEAAKEDLGGEEAFEQYTELSLALIATATGQRMPSMVVLKALSSVLTMLSVVAVGTEGTTDAFREMAKAIESEGPDFEERSGKMLSIAMFALNEGECQCEDCIAEREKGTETVH